MKSPKSGDFENKNYIGRSPDPFPSHPNAKKEKRSGYARLLQCGSPELKNILVDHMHTRDSYIYRAPIISIILKQGKVRVGYILRNGTEVV